MQNAGANKFKTCCSKFKRLREGIQADCMVDDGYTHDFYFCNEPVNKKLIADGFCPMHCRLIHMFWNLRDPGHWCKMDNSFNSVNLASAAYHDLNNKVLIHGDIEKSGQSVPPLVFQEEVMAKRADAACGNVKAPVLKNDIQSSSLIIASCYNQKPFCINLYSIPRLSWVECSKRIRSHELKKIINFNFL